MQVHPFLVRLRVVAIDVEQDALLGKSGAETVAVSEVAGKRSVEVDGETHIVSLGCLLAVGIHSTGWCCVKGEICGE